MNRRWSRTTVGIAVFLIAVHVLLSWLARRAGILTDNDTGQYLLLARSVSNLQYRDLWVVGAPFHVHFPPLFPVLLAAWHLVVGERFALLVLMNLAAAAGALSFFTATVGRLWSPRLALACLAPLAANSRLVLRAGNLHSEAVFLLFAALALWALGRQSPSRQMLVVAGASAIAAALTRSIGIALVAGILLFWLFERRWRAVVSLGTAAVMTFGAWILWTLSASSGHRSYVAELTGNETRVDTLMLPAVTGLRQVRRLRRLAVQFLPDSLNFPTIHHTPIDNVIGALIAVVCVAIGLYFISRRWRPAALFVIAYAGILILWPWFLNRFLEPLIPLFTLALLIGVGTLAGRWGGSVRRVAIAVVALGMTLTGATRSLAHIHDRSGCAAGRMLSGPRECLQPDQVSFFDALRYIRDSLPADANVLSAKAAAMYTYTGHRSPPYAIMLETPRASFLQAVEEDSADYVLLGSLQGSEIKKLSRILAAHCHELAVVKTFAPETVLFRIRRSQKSADGFPYGEACKILEEYRKVNSGRMSEWDGK